MIGPGFRILVRLLSWLYKKEEGKKCPYCRKRNSLNAIICAHCGKDFREHPDAINSPTRKEHGGVVFRK